MKKNKHYNILFATILYIMIGIFSIFWISKWIAQHHFEIMGENTQNLAAIAANALTISDAQLEELQRISFDELLGNESNQELNNLFETTALSSNVKYAYVIRKLDKDAIKYYVDKSDSEFYEEPEGTSLDWIWLMDVLVNREEQEEANQDEDYYADKNRYTHISGETATLYEKKESGFFINNDEWGSQISGMVPIYTVEGQYIGLLGVDVYSNSFYQYRDKVLAVLFLLLMLPTAILTIIFVKYHLRYQKDIKCLAYVDNTTSLYTRTYYENYGREQLKKLRRVGDTFTVIMIDIDEFKAYNDYYGHTKGDDCLKKIGECIRFQAELVGGCPGRYGGEEFIILAPNISIECGNTLCENIRMEVEKLLITHEKREDTKIVTISLGVYTGTHNDIPFDLKKLIDMADKGLYMAKRNGRNCYRRIL